MEMIPLTQFFSQIGYNILKAHDGDGWQGDPRTYYGDDYESRLTVTKEPLGAGVYGICDGNTRSVLMVVRQEGIWAFPPSVMQELSAKVRAGRFSGDAAADVAVQRWMNG